MLTLDSLDWRDHLILTRELVTAGERAEFFGRVQRGDFVPLRRGVYMGSEHWGRLDADARYRARVKGVIAFSKRDLVVSHHSAAALWRLPWVGGFPRTIHVLDDRADGGRSSSVITRHAVGVPEVIERVEGIAVTSMARTVTDLCRVLPFPNAVVVADAALRRTEHPIEGVPRSSLTRDDLERELSLVPLRHGTAKARRAIGFADGAADRAGESLSRANMSLACITMPRLQVEMRGANGRTWIVDFWWETFNMIGEFDGDAKYTDPEFLRGRTPEQTLRDEKAREDDLRAARHGMTRWSWDRAISMPKLRRHLLAAGIH
jgi:hypothetical protein